MQPGMPLIVPSAAEGWNTFSRGRPTSSFRAQHAATASSRAGYVLSVLIGRSGRAFAEEVLLLPDRQAGNQANAFSLPSSTVHRPWCSVSSWGPTLACWLGNSTTAAYCSFSACSTTKER
jgi:hypothetical protein